MEIIPIQCLSDNYAYIIKDTNSKMIGVTKKIKWSNINTKFNEMNYSYYKCGGKQNNGSCVANSIPAKAAFCQNLSKKRLLAPLRILGNTNSHL